MTLKQAHARARRRSLESEEELWIVHEEGYHVATRDELHAFFNGLREQDIVGIYARGTFYQ